MTIPRQLAPTMGPAHDGDEFLEGSFLRDREVHDFTDEKEPAQKDIQSLRVKQSERHTRLRLTEIKVCVLYAADDLFKPPPV